MAQGTDGQVLDGPSSTTPSSGWNRIVPILLVLAALGGIAWLFVRPLFTSDSELRRFAFQRFDTSADHTETLRRLRTADPSTYLRIIRKERGEAAWLSELAKLSPAQYRLEQQNQLRRELALERSQADAAVAERQAAFDGTGCSVSLGRFYALQSGMRYSAVHKLLGCNGTENSQVSVGGYITVMYSWRGEGGLGANMNVMFQNGRLVSKAQFGLQ